MVIEPKTAGGGTFATPIPVDTAPHYQILGLATQAERWVKQYQQCLMAARALEDTTRQEVTALEAHITAVYRRLEQADIQLAAMQGNAASLLQKIYDNFAEITAVVEDAKLHDQYPMEPLEDFLGTVESMPPVGVVNIRAIIAPLGDVKTHTASVRVPQTHMDSTLTQGYDTVRHICTQPIAALESKLARRF